MSPPTRELNQRNAAVVQRDQVQSRVVREVSDSAWRLIPSEFLESPLAPGHEVWTIPKVLRRCGGVWRHEGLRILWLKILGETVYRRLLLLQYDLRRSPPRINTGIPVEIRILEIERRAIELYTAFRPDTSPWEVSREMECGGQCFVATYAGSIVSATWTFVGRGPVPYLGVYLQAGPSDVVLNDSYTQPAFRGRNVSPAVGAAMVRHFREYGYRHIVTAVLPENNASLRSRGKAGFRVCGRIGFVGPAARRRHFYRVHSEDRAAT